MKHFILLCLVGATCSVAAQEYRPFKLNAAVGLAKPTDSGITVGLLLDLEPKYGITRTIDLGLRLEWALIARGVSTNGQTSTGNVGVFGSYLATGTYLFGRGNTRPFAGLGAGVYRVISTSTLVVIDGQSPQTVTLLGQTKFGGMLRAGIKTGHFLITAEYNAVPATTDQVGSTTLRSQNAYAGLKLGVDIGGGQK